MVSNSGALEEAGGATTVGSSRPWKPLVHCVRSSASFLLYCLRWDFRLAEPRHKVAYLDGLRGVAALIVFCSHSFGIAYPEFGALSNVPFGFGGDYYYITFPVVRLFFSGGPFAVCCFFIISGYAISVAPLRKLHNNQHSRLAADLGVSFPRRFVRLYIPVLGTTFVYMSCWSIFWENPEQSWARETLTWFHNFLQQSYYFSLSMFWKDRYNGHLWSIGTEMRGSYTVYVALLCAVGFHQRGTTFRMFAYLGVLFYLMFLVLGEYIALFLVGMMMCDLQGLSDSGELPLWALKLQASTQRRSGWIFWTFAAFSIFLSGCPGGSEDDYKAYGGVYSMMRWLKPIDDESTWRWWMCWGAICVMIMLSHSPSLRWLLETKLCQWLGKISFSLYLVHGPVLYTIGGAVYRVCGLINDGLGPGGDIVLATPQYGPIGCDTRFLLAQCIMVPLTFYLAIVATKLFDEPSIKIARYLCSPAPPAPRLRGNAFGDHMELLGGILPSHNGSSAPVHEPERVKEG